LVSVGVGSALSHPSDDVPEQNAGPAG
jgi:hypothetical protein